MVVGMGLAQHSFRAALTKGSVITAVKLVLQPLLVWIIAKMLGLGTLETNAVVLMASLPVAINIYLMAQDSKPKKGLQATAIFVSTFSFGFDRPADAYALRRSASILSFRAAFIKNSAADHQSTAEIFGRSFRCAFRLLRNARALLRTGIQQTSSLQAS